MPLPRTVHCVTTNKRSWGKVAVSVKFPQLNSRIWNILCQTVYLTLFIHMLVIFHQYKIFFLSLCPSLSVSFTSPTFLHLTKILSVSSRPRDPSPPQQNGSISALGPISSWIYFAIYVPHIYEWFAFKIPGIGDGAKIHSTCFASRRQWWWLVFCYLSLIFLME